MVFQLMFAIITPALITGAFAERMKFSAFLLFSLLWATLVYFPLAHMVWGDGGLDPRAGRPRLRGRHGRPHLLGRLGASPPRSCSAGGRASAESRCPRTTAFTVIGAGLLWVGWFGFNAGSALGAGGLAVTAFVTTNTAAAAATWLVFAEWSTRGKPTVLGAASGAWRGSSPSRRPRASSRRWAPS